MKLSIIASILVAAQAEDVGFFGSCYKFRAFDNSRSYMGENTKGLLDSQATPTVWRITKGRTGTSGTVSIQDANRKGYFIRH